MTLAVLDLQHTIDELMRDLNLPLEDLAGALAAHPRTVQRWREDEALPQKLGRQRLNELDALRDRLYETFSDSQAVYEWMHASNRYLGGLTPAEVARAGRIDRIEAALEVLDLGIFV